MIKPKRFPLAAIASTGVLTATLSLGQFSTLSAQDAPPPPPAADRARPLPPPPREGDPGPGPRGERPPPPPPPDADQPPALPVDPQVAPQAVKTAIGALAGLSAGQVWTRTAPRGEQQVEATLMFQGREVSRLEFDPRTGSLLTRGEGGPLPLAVARNPGAPGAPVPPPGAPVPPPADRNGPVPPPPDANAPAPGADVPVPPTPVNLDSVKVKLAEIIKALSVGQGAELMPREGFWKVPIIYQSRVVGELRLSGDGTKVIEDFGAARDAAIFAR